MSKSVLFNIVLFFFTTYTVGATVRPQNYGLLKAKSGEERYWALYKAHNEANRLGTTVDYSGIGSLSIEIPQNAKPIIIDESQDFKGLKLTVKNNWKNHYLFVCSRTAKNIEVPQSIIDRGDFRSVPELKYGVKLLLIKDAKPWVEHRKGHNYGAIRRDVLLLINGIAQNKTITPYGNQGVSLPECRYVEADLKPKKIGNLTFIRSDGSKYMTFLISVANINNIELYDIQCYTPEDDSKYGDNIIVVDCSANVTYRNITIEGMYTQDDKYGYGISMNNVWNVKLYNVSGNVKQGIICNSNINKSFLKNCKINRYDIHCYGRDAEMEDCTFKGMYFPVASFYGKIVFRRCSFVNSQPVWIRADYNAYVPFDIEIYDCFWYPVKGRDALCYAGELDNEVNGRLELCKKYWPSIKVRGLNVYPSDKLNAIYVFRVGGDVDSEQTVGYLPFVDIEGLNVHGMGMDLSVCNKKIKTSQKPRIRIKQKRGSRAKVQTKSFS